MCFFGVKVKKKMGRYILYLRYDSFFSVCVCVCVCFVSTDQRSHCMTKGNLWWKESGIAPENVYHNVRIRGSNCVTEWTRMNATASYRAQCAKGDRVCIRPLLPDFGTVNVLMPCSFWVYVPYLVMFTFECPLLDA